MAATSSLLQGSQLPTSVATTQTQSVAPEFYTNYLQDIANLGQNAITQGGVAGLSPLQQQAFQMAPTASFSGADTAGTAANMLRTAGTTTAPSVVNQYMDPYQKNVVDEMARLSNLNVQRNILPSLRAAGVSTGGLGSSRMANVTGQTLADIQANLTGQQYGALSQGYKNAIEAAQTDLARGLQAGSGLTSTAGTQSNIGLSGLKNLAEMGALEQAQGQKILDLPMQQAQNFANLLKTYTIPVGSVQQVTQPGQQGQFTNSPLSQIAGLIMALGSLGGGVGGGSNTGSAGSSSLLSSLLDPSKWASIFGLADGGVVHKADGGAIRGGLQSMVQGMNPSMNPHIPVNENPMNAHIPDIGMNPPMLNVNSLNYQNDPNAYNLNRSTMTGALPNTSMMVG